MKVAILAGGTGSRLSEETEEKPKALVEIGGRPILLHLMEHYAAFGYDDFVIATGYKSEQVAAYFSRSELSWSIQTVDTGGSTATGGRIKRLGPHLGGETFLLTWCDGLSDIDLGELVSFHRRHGKLATVTAAHPPTKFGHLALDGQRVVEFVEKPRRAREWINGAFFVLEPAALDYIDGDATEWERESMPRLAADGELMAYRHEGFWQCMDTVHERDLLEEMWRTGNAPWTTAESKG